MEIFLLLIAVGVVFYIKNKKPKQTPYNPGLKNRYKPKTKNTYHKQTTKPQKTITEQESPLAITRKNKYLKQSVLNKSEQKIYWLLVKIIKNHNSIKLFPQISLGEILASKNGYKTIQCKRVDFCITDKWFNPIMVVEYNGLGHYQGNYKERDDIKEIATTSAGIKYVAIKDDNVEPQLKLIDTTLKSLTANQ
jgi:hypothetical protein